MTNIIRPTRAEINLNNLDHNLTVTKNLVGNRKVMAVVKANAYGHGLVEISKRLEKNSIDYLAVAFIEEALQLRDSNIKTPILVLGGINNEQIPLFLKNDIDITGSSIEKLKAISTSASTLNLTANVHLKIDTGMGRIGVQWNRVDEFLKVAFSLPNINIKGVFSHFISSSHNPEFTKLQIERFNTVLNKIFPKYAKKKNILIHLSNSGAVANNYKNAFFDMVRSGLMIYGYSPIPKIQDMLKPVMTFKTKVSYFKVLDKGLTVGYDGTYTTKSKTRIVTLPLGYADGYPRSLSNKGEVIIRNKKYHIAGRVCMDQCMVDIGINGEAYNGDDVLLWGKDGRNVIDLWNVSKLANRSLYETLCSISKRVPKIYIP
ncbi:TPA: alanine racemase [Patescibacteria group bacterium]|nr:alanine racemase [Patescibacteria group bacterium]